VGTRRGYGDDEGARLPPMLRCLRRRDDRDTVDLLAPLRRIVVGECHRLRSQPTQAISDRAAEEASSEEDERIAPEWTNDVFECRDRALSRVFKIFRQKIIELPSWVVGHRFQLPRGAL